MRYDLHKDNAAFFSRQIKRENDASITKTLSRRLDLWIRCNFDDLFFEVKTLHERLKKLRRKRELDYFKAFDKQKNSSSISNALRCLSDVAKGGVLSTSGKVTSKDKTAQYSIFYKKHPCSQKGDLK